MMPISNNLTLTNFNNILFELDENIIESTVQLWRESNFKIFQIYYSQVTYAHTPENLYLSLNPGYFCF